MERSSDIKNDVYIVDGARTPFLKARGKPGAFSASDLAVAASRELLNRYTFSPTEIDEVILGCMMPGPEEANIARVVALRIGCGKSVPAFTVQRNCASGMQALDSAFRNISSGRSHLVLAGGTEAMSHAPLMFNDKMVNWFAGLAGAKNINAKLSQFARFRPAFLSPVVALLKGLTDHTVNLNMGQTAEIVAHRFNISREQMDQFALSSHQRSAAATDEKHFTKMIPVFSAAGEYSISDDGIRRDSTLEKLATLKPFFDKKFGSVTAGNSSQVTDGSAMLLLASASAVKKYQLPVLAKLIDVEWAGLDPAEMGLGPVYASEKLLRQQNLSANNIDYWEINEAFAAQVLGCLAAWESEDYCREFLGMDRAFGKVNPDRLNVDGGAIALGHPVGASGARIVLQLAQILRRENAKKGVASICIGGGQGGAALIENVTEVTA
ncbi:MAG: acetyl-CoA C-acetyltransferase [Gammaproteobacteria bacterium]|nr:acetyl-CoA C-acetyltransferase [Gammaproteobacteria bacterium]